MPSGDALSENKLKRSQYCNGKGYEEHVVAMGIGGPVRIFASHDNEFPPSKLAATVTETKGKWVVKLDDRPAEEVYRRLRGMKADEKLTSDWQHPIGVVISPQKVYLRMILNWVGADGKDKDGQDAGAPPGSLRFVSPVVKGTKVRCLAGGDDARAIVASARRGVSEAVADAQAAGYAPALALISNCCARGMRLRTFRKANDDEVTEAILPALGANVPVFGFYAWGELGRIRGEYQRLDHQYQQHTFVTSVVAVER
ncbi:MAG: FIST C-terminal domain-containing protein [Phycisphaerae bacterium]